MTVAIKVFQDSYRAHLDELRAKKNPSDLLRTDNYKYFLTIYKVIIEEMVKMVFGIEVTGDSVNYVKPNKDKVIECISDESNTYKSIESYDASNWNYLLLVNVLNQVKHSDQQVNAQLIEDTATLIEKQDKYNKYKAQLNNAVHDITEYFNELELYGYLERARECKWNENELGTFDTEEEFKTDKRKTAIETMENLFTEMKVMTRRIQDIDVEDKNLTNIRVIKPEPDRIFTFEGKQYTQKQYREKRVYKIIQYNHSVHDMKGDPEYDREEVTAFTNKYWHPSITIHGVSFDYIELYFLESIGWKVGMNTKSNAIKVLHKAETNELTEDETQFLDIWSTNNILHDVDFYQGCYIYNTPEQVWKDIKRRISKIVNQYNKKRRDGLRGLGKICDFREAYENYVKELIQSPI